MFAYPAYGGSTIRPPKEWKLVRPCLPFRAPWCQRRVRAVTSRSRAVRRTPLEHSTVILSLWLQAEAARPEEQTGAGDGQPRNGHGEKKRRPSIDPREGRKRSIFLGPNQKRQLRGGKDAKSRGLLQVLPIVGALWVRVVMAGLQIWHVTEESLWGAAFA